MRDFERHDFVTLRPDWRRHCIVPAGDAGRVGAWQAAGRPFVVAARRPGDGEEALRLGLAGPGRTRLSFVAGRAALDHHAPPPLLAEAAAVCPAAWQPMLGLVKGLAATPALCLRVYGSVAWQALTGLSYLTPESDLDLLIEARQSGLAGPVLEALGNLAGPVRLDGELRLAGVGDIAWREWRSGAHRVLVKTRQGPRLACRDEAA